jgi:cytochrome b561
VQDALANNAVERWAGNLTHATMYAFMFVLPGSGIAMGYFGGKGKDKRLSNVYGPPLPFEVATFSGLPFFGTVIPGAATPNGKIAGSAFKVHKNAGLAFEYFTALHVGAVGFHMMMGQPILARMGIGAFPK